MFVIFRELIAPVRKPSYYNKSRFAVDVCGDSQEVTYRDLLGAKRHMSRLPELLLQKRKPLAVVSLLLAMALALGCVGLKMKTHYSVFFDASDPNLVAHQAMETEFTPADNVYFVVRSKGESIYTADTLAAVSRLTELSWALPYSVRVDSLANYNHVTGSGDELVARNLFDNPAELSPQQLSELQSLVSSKPEIHGLLVSTDAEFAGVNVNLALPYASEQAAMEVTVAARELKDQVLGEFPQVQIDILGQVPFNWIFNEMAMVDGETLFPVMFLLMFFVIACFFRSVAAVVVTLIVISASSAAAMGFGGLLGYSLNAINLVAGTIIMTVAVADSVHLLAEFNNSVRRGSTPQQAMLQSLQINYWPITVTSLTTAIGFLGLNFSASPPFRELGNMTAFGVVVAWLLSLGAFPALYLGLVSDKHLKKLAQAGERSSGRFLQSRLPNWLIGTRPRYLISTGIITLLLISLTAQNRLDERVLTYFDADVPFRATVENIQDTLLGFDRIAYSIQTRQEAGINDPGFLHLVDDFVAWARTQPEVTHVASYTDVVKDVNRVLHEGNDTYYRVPDATDKAAQLLLLYEMSLPFGADIKHLVNHDKSGLRVSIGLSSQSAKGLLAFDRKAQQWLARNNDSSDYRVSRGASVSMMFAHIGMENIKSMISGNLLATLLVTICLMLFLASVKYGLLTLLPNVVPALVAFGVWGMLVGEINMAIAVVFCITLGIVVDDTVHFTAKYLHGRRQLGLEAADAVRYAYSRVSHALLVTTVVLVSGFLVLGLSSLSVNSSMGILVALTIAVAFVYDLFVFPRILLAVDGGKDAQTVAQTDNLSDKVVDAGQRG